MKIDLDLIISESKKIGLDLVSCIDPAVLVNDKRQLRDWQSSGYAGDMTYMMRPAELLSDPLKVFPETKSVLVFALYYDRAKAPEFKKGSGRVARYAWGKDYHKVIRKLLKKLLNNLKIFCGEGLQFRAFTDSVPLLERALAAKAGMGFVGKNSMLIRPRTGSYFFIAEILSNLQVKSNRLPVVSENCGSCTNCRSMCPTGAIVGDRVVDARLCISYLTIEKKGMLDLTERQSLGEWIFGCDVCQEVCPFNHRPLKEEYAPQLEEFNSAYGAGPLLNLSDVLSIRNQDQFLAKFAGTALMRAGRESMLRNAAYVAANTAAEETVPFLEKSFYEDPSEVVRASSFWSLSKINDKCDILTANKLNEIKNKAYKSPLIIKSELDYAK